MMKGNKPSVLVVEDDVPIRNLITTTLEMEKYKFDTAENGNQAIMLAAANNPDIILMDLGLPDIDGIEVIRKIRTWSVAPIIVISARSDEKDKVAALDVGADDYLTKPFLPLELVARVKAQLRRYTRYNVGAEQNQDIFIHHGLVLNRKTHECTLNEKPLSLTPTEFEILAILCEKKGSVVSSEELFHQIWKDEYYSKNNNTITVHIRHLREKMQDSFEKPKYIKTVWGCGYKIEN